MSLSTASALATRDARPRGVVGPNAVLQLMDPLRAVGGESLLRDIFTRAGGMHHLTHPPTAMVPETQVRDLFVAVREFLGPEQGDEVLALAGAGTAHYVMQHRIPAPIRGLLRVLPPALAARLLSAAIRRNAWTFAGSGHCGTVVQDGRAVITIGCNPLATPGCAWHTGVLETLFKVLVAPTARARHGACVARGGTACRFELSWGQATSAEDAGPPPALATR